MRHILIIIGLLLSLLFLLQGIWFTLRTDYIVALAPQTSQEEKIEKEASATLVKNLLFPEVPTSIPDLTQGYLFTEERTLEEGDMQKAEEEGQTGGEKAVDLAQVFYEGSIIMGENKVAIIITSALEVAAGPKQPFSFPKKGGAGPHPGATVTRHLQLKTGETLGEYVVADILPDKVVFKKGEETIEKLLYDPAKQRVAAAVPVEQKSPPGQPQPGVSQHTPGTRRDAAQKKRILRPPVPPSPQSFAGRKPDGTPQTSPVSPPPAAVPPPEVQTPEDQELENEMQEQQIQQMLNALPPDQQTENALEEILTNILQQQGGQR